MNAKSTGITAGRKVLIAVLIAADAALFAIGAVTIPKHFHSAETSNDLYASAQTTPARNDAGHGVQVFSDDPQPQTEPPEQAEPAQQQQQPGKAQQQEPAEPEGQAQDAALSTGERPDLGDFLWYTDGVFYEGVPADAARIDRDAVSGGWKAIILYDPENAHDASAMEFLNVDISEETGNVSLVLDWYSIFLSKEGQSIDESDMQDSVFTGAWEGAGLWASGSGTILLTEFYAANNKQYAVGTMDTPDGIPAYVALVRP